MQAGKPSQTALGAAGHRAVHHLIDTPVLLPDPVIIAIMDAMAGKQADREGLRQHAPATARLRAQIVARSLFAEETLAAAVARGVDQYVLLGAGLDTFAYRNPWPRLRVFEVDAPASGAWKQGALETASVPIPANVVYAPVDFEHEPLMHGLARAGFDATRPAVFAWLGVALYLTRPAIETTLHAIAALPAGTELVFDYSVRPDSLPEPGRSAFREMMANVAARGEPWISFFMPAEMSSLLAGCGFAEVEDLSGLDINRRWYAGRTDGLAASPVSHIVRAKV